MLSGIQGDADLAVSRFWQPFPGHNFCHQLYGALDGLGVAGDGGKGDGAPLQNLTLQVLGGNPNSDGWLPGSQRLHVEMLTDAGEVQVDLRAPELSDGGVFLRLSFLGMLRLLGQPPGSLDPVDAELSVCLAGVVRDQTDQEVLLVESVAVAVDHLLEDLPLPLIWLEVGESVDQVLEALRINLLKAFIQRNSNFKIWDQSDRWLKSCGQKVSSAEIVLFGHNF